jgi:hypothetical protein
VKVEEMQMETEPAPDGSQMVDPFSVSLDVVTSHTPETVKPLTESLAEIPSRVVDTDADYSVFSSEIS